MTDSMFKSKRNSHLELNGKEMPHASFCKHTAHQFLKKLTAEKKLDYIHLNPLQEKWNLAEYPEDYKWSSAGFYNSGIDDFGILTHYMDRF